MALRIAILILLCLSSIARGQPVDAGVDAPPADATPTDAGPPPDAPAQPQLVPPQAIGDTTVPTPIDAPTITAPVVVTVKILVGKDGVVQTVTLVTAPQPIFDDAVIAAVKNFKFAPATFDGKPVKVEITFTHTFEVPPPPTAAPTASGPARTAVLKGRLVQLGTRKAVQNATVTAEIAGTTYAAEADAEGRFRLEVPPGQAKVAVHAPAHNVFLQAETFAEKQEIEVTYYVERDRYDPYEIIVTGEQRREEVSRITLRGREIQQVPGTFGDPYRVVQALPGVASVTSLLPFPVVRGASPSSTGLLIDGTRVPLMYHLLAGPSVIHPEFIDEIQFYPGGAPVPYGGYTGGIVDGRTRRARPGESLIDVDANFLQTGGFVRQPIGKNLNVTAAGRYGYPGLLLSLATNEASLSYWDYQVRVDGGTKANGWTIFSFGASDTLESVAQGADPNDPEPPLEPSLILTFHRLDLRYVRTFGNVETLARVVGGYDRTYSGGTDFTTLLAEPEALVRWKQSKRLTLAAGLQGAARSLDQGDDAMAGEGGSMVTSELSTSYSGSAYTEALWRPTENWLVRPGVRAAVFHDKTATKVGVDPRISGRYKLGERDVDSAAPGSDDRAIWLKGAIGIYHQPPRFVIPLPGLDQMPLKYGLLRSYQTSFGVEAPLDHSLQLSTEAYFNYLDPTVFDLSFNAASVATEANTSLFPPEMDDNNEFVDRLTTPQTGRSYGLEVMLKRVAKNGLFGWISYTLSRSERNRNDNWALYDFDRTHLLNVVAGLPLKRNWDIGLRLTYQSGTPETTTAGYNTARGNGYVRFDVRVDKRAVWRKWLLDFYVDITNVALLPEEVNPGATIRYVLPTLGLRGRF